MLDEGNDYAIQFSQFILFIDTINIFIKEVFYYNAFIIG